MMKKFRLLFLLMCFSFLVQSQELIVGLGAIANYTDGVKTNIGQMDYTPSLDIRFINEISDGHHLLVYTEFSNNKNRGAAIKLRAGFTMFINAIPFDDFLINEGSNWKLRMLFGMGFEYDTYWETGDFVPVIKLHTAYKKIALEAGIQTHLVESYHYNTILEYRVGLYYTIL